MNNPEGVSTMLIDLLAVNTRDKSALPEAGRLGFGLEVEEYMFALTEEEILEKQKTVPKLMDGFSKFSFHGVVIGYDDISRHSEAELLSKYNASFRQADFHHIERVVYHANYVAGYESESSWIDRQSAFWQRFLRDKQASARVYLENFVDDTPGLMARLCDAVDDPRFSICFDAGHARCNSKIAVGDWIKQLGRRIGHVHLHNNDGLTDRHWPLGRGVLNDREVIECLLEYTNAEMIVLECDFEESLMWLEENDLTTPMP